MPSDVDTAGMDNSKVDQGHRLSLVHKVVTFQSDDEEDGASSHRV